MKDLILVPTYGRPEYLYLQLEHILKADGGREKDIWVCHDQHTADQSSGPAQRAITETKQVAGSYNGKLKISMRVRNPHPWIGNPYNFLELYREAQQTPGYRYVYLIEDDVMVAKDFFDWHEAVQARGDYFVSVGWDCKRNKEAIKDNDPNGLIESFQDFSSIGICWKHKNLEAIAKHSKVDYYRAMPVYLKGAFPDSPVPSGQWTEQAGVITRLLHERNDRLTVWPTLTRCAHVGVSGYHRQNGPKFVGTFEEKVNQLRAALNDPEEMKRLNKSEWDDISCLKQVPRWHAADLKVVQRFEWVKGKIG